MALVPIVCLRIQALATNLVQMNLTGFPCLFGIMGRLGQTFLLFFGRGTGPKRSGTVLACFWTNFQAKPSILDPIRAVFDDLGPNRHFGPDLDLQDQARDWPGGPGPAHTFFSTPGGRDSGRLGLSVRTWLAEAATAADLKVGSGGAKPPQEKKFKLVLNA